MRVPLALVGRSVLVVFILLVGSARLVAAASKPPDAAASKLPEAQLVMLAEPRPPAGVADSKGALTLPYRVLEVFSGEPGSASVVVRHAQLDPMDRQRLASGERVIVMARPDGDNPGRWVGSAPLRATDEAIAAFRKWGAPADVRAQTPLEDAVAVAKRSTGEVPGTVAPDPTPVEAPEPKAVPEPKAAPPAKPAPVPEVEDESVAGADEWHEVPVAAPEPEGAAPEPASVEPHPERADLEPASAEPEDDDRPLEFLDDSPSRLIPSDGPGLPGSPSARILGPALSDRPDLKP